MVAKEGSPTERVIRLHAKEIYGITKYYPANATAEIFCEISKTKTMTREIIDQVKRLGYKVVRAKEDENEIE